VIAKYIKRGIAYQAFPVGLLCKLGKYVFVAVKLFKTLGSGQPQIAINTFVDSHYEVGMNAVLHTRLMVDKLTRIPIKAIEPSA
jgi:hypothetical protein